VCAKNCFKLHRRQDGGVNVEGFLPPPRGHNHLLSTLKVHMDFGQEVNGKTIAIPKDAVNVADLAREYLAITT
jgi:hypothetical protein